MKKGNITSKFEDTERERGKSREYSKEEDKTKKGVRRDDDAPTELALAKLRKNYE